MVVDGSHITIRDFHFTDGDMHGDVIQLNGSYCRLTESAIIDYRNVDTKRDPMGNFDWVLIGPKAERNRVDHCWFEGKRSLGKIIEISFEKVDRPKLHRIDHNYFTKIPMFPVIREINGEKREMQYACIPIYIGVSIHALIRARVVVEDNLFEDIGGNYIVETKTSECVIRHNTVRALARRHRRAHGT